ncbi:hypothetical protein HBA54_18965 [Pelagibius litoralis]|uniref:Uncharacterized protein n=1 Tax=Pelagibius litoralis TaxID=374515 RepID=A0A967F055_9PROT|nr:hypothetical protein [Pelagibius litoralis]NIA70683.1 hypothetical protein [Pelagibius litoralis]
MSKFLKTTVLALAASAAIGGSAQAAQLFSLNYMTVSAAQPNKPPKLEFFLKDGEYVLGKGAAQRSVKIRVVAKTQNVGRIQYYRVISKNADKQIAKQGGFNAKEMDVTFNHKVSHEELKPLISLGRQVCENSGVRHKVHKDLIKKGLKYKMVVRAIRWNPGAEDYGSGASSTDVQVICNPEKFRVKDVKLSVKYHGSASKCPVKVTVTAKFKTTGPSGKKIKFMYVRGDGEHQTIETKTYGSLGDAVWHKSYTINKSVNRKYMLSLFTSPIATQWVPVKVNCDRAPGGIQHGLPAPTNQ